MGLVAVDGADVLVTMAFERAPIATALISPQGTWLRVNKALCELLGYSASELLATTIQKVTHPEDLEASLEQLRRLLAGELDHFEMAMRYLQRAGIVVWWSGQPLARAHGRGDPRVPHRADPQPSDRR